ncbi:unnamed protein product [Urochloa humidicola]
MGAAGSWGHGGTPERCGDMASAVGPSGDRGTRRPATSVKASGSAVHPCAAVLLLPPDFAVRVSSRRHPPHHAAPLSCLCGGENHPRRRSATSTPWPRSRRRPVPRAPCHAPGLPLHAIQRRCQWMH